jgi:DNA-binding beta-propeller fold protein YncE
MTMVQRNTPIVLARRPMLSWMAAGITAAAIRPAQAAEPSLLRMEPAPALYELVHSRSQNALFVASAGGFGDGAAPSKLLRLDPATLALQAEIALPHRGFGVTLDDAAGRLYVGHSLDAAISAVDIASNRVVGTAKLADMVRGEDGRERAPYSLRELQLSADGSRIYAPGLGMTDSVLYAVDTRSMALNKAITGIGPGATGIAMDAAGGRVFVSTLLGRLVTVDVRTEAVVREVAAGGAEQPLNLAFDTTTNRVLAVDQGLESMPAFQAKMQPGFTSRTPGNRIVALDPETGRLLQAAPAGQGPVALRLDAERKRLYVTNREGAALIVLDAGSFATLATVPLAAHPNSLALDEQTGTLYVTVKNGRDAPKGAKEAVVRIAF